MPQALEIKNDRKYKTKFKAKKETYIENNFTFEHKITPRKK